MSRIYSFEREPYLRELRVEVVDAGQEAGRAFVVLDDTILFPEGGGQPADHGWLEGVRIVDVQKSGSELRHFCEHEIGLGAGRLELEWERRFDHMQQHTAQHLLTSLALRRFGWVTRSFHIGPQVSDIELDIEPPSATEIESLEDAVSEAVAAAHSIRSFRVTPEEYSRLEVRSRGLPANHTGDLRLVEIEGVDLNTCGGTHVGSTAEVAAVKIVRSETLRGGCRLFWVAGKRVRRRLAAQEARVAELRSLLDTGDEELAAVVGLRLEQLNAARRQQRLLEARLAEVIVEGLLGEPQGVVQHAFDRFEANLLRPVAELFAERGGHRVALLTAEGEGDNLFAVVAGKQAELNLQTAGRRVAQLLEGRGGGKGQVYQGKAGSLRRLREALAELERVHEPKR